MLLQDFKKENTFSDESLENSMEQSLKKIDLKKMNQNNKISELNNRFVSNNNQKVELSKKYNGDFIDLNKSETIYYNSNSNFKETDETSKSLYVLVEKNKKKINMDFSNIKNIINIEINKNVDFSYSTTQKIQNNIEDGKIITQKCLEEQLSLNDELQILDDANELNTVIYNDNKKKENNFSKKNNKRSTKKTFNSFDSNTSQDLISLENASSDNSKTYPNKLGTKNNNTSIIYNRNNYIMESSTKNNTYNDDCENTKYQKSKDFKYSISCPNNLGLLNKQKKINESFTFLPIETKYFKISKDNNVIHIPNIQDFECLACFHIVNEPKVCAECEKLICQECLEIWWSEKTRSNFINHLNNNKEKECIHCKKTFYDLFMPRIVRNSLNSIVIKCPNFNSNTNNNTLNINNEKYCKESFEYQYLLQHLENCKLTKREAVCNFCKEIIQTTNEKIEIYNHLKICSLADIVCENCNRIIPRKKFEKHKSKCEKKYIKCHDCSVLFSISEFENHSKKECIYMIVEKFNNEILIKNKKIESLEQEKKDLLKYKKIKEFVPFFIRFIVNKNKLHYSKIISENENFVKIVQEKFVKNLFFNFII